MAAKEAKARIKINKLLEESVRKSVSFDKFGSISVPIPPPAIQLRLVEHIGALQQLEARFDDARLELAAGELERTLVMVGLGRT